MAENTYGARKFLLDMLMKERSLDRDALNECNKIRTSERLTLAEVLVSEGVVTDQELGLLLDKFEHEGHISHAELSLLNNEFPSNWERWKEMEERDDEVEAREGEMPQMDTELLPPMPTDADIQDSPIEKEAPQEIPPEAEIEKKERPLTERVTRGTLQEALEEMMSDAPVKELKVPTLKIDKKGEDEDSFIGRTVCGAKIIEKMSKGQVGTVYKGIIENLKKDVAVRIVRSDFVNPGRRKRMLEYAEKATKIEHRNVAEIISTEEESRFFYIVSRYVDGETLRSKLKVQGKLPQEEALNVTLQIARALRAGHEQDIFHGDIKPENIIFDKDGQVVLVDLGLLKTAEIDSASSSKQSQFMGTPQYMSLIQFDAKAADARSDIYSLGITLYEILSGILPFDGTTPFAVRDAHEKKSPQVLTEIDNRISPVIAKLVAKMISKNPDDRYQDANNLINDMVELKQYLASGGTEPPIARADSKGAPELDESVRARAQKYKTVSITPDWEKKRKIKLSHFIILFILLLAIAGGAYTFIMKPDWLKISANFEEEANKEFAEIKRKADLLISQQNYLHALQKLDTFPSKYTASEARRKLEAYRISIFSAADANFSEEQKRIEEVYGLERIADAKRLLRALDSNVKDIINEFGGQWPEAAALQKYVDFSQELENQITETLKKLENFEEDLAFAEALLKDDRVDDALAAIKIYLSSPIAKHRDEAGKLASLIEIRKKKLEAEEAIKAELESFQAAVEEARKDMGNNDFESALARIRQFETSEKQRIKIEAGLIRAEIENKRNEFDAQMAEENRRKELAKKISLGYGLIEKGNYDEVIALVMKEESNRNMTEEEKQQLVKLKEEAKHHIRFLKDIEAIDSLISKKEFKRARQLCLQWRYDTRTFIKNSANRKYLQIMDLKEPDMAYIEGGTAIIGSDDKDDENPEHNKIYPNFYMDRHEVTCDEYNKFVADKKHAPPTNWPRGTMPRQWANTPVTGITLADAAAYAKWAGKRLPTEIEWEIAASWNGKEKVLYPWGNEFDIDKANIATGDLLEVGTTAADKSFYGIMDMAGNAAEWTATKSGDKYVIRGSSADKNAKSEFARSTRRNYMTPATTTNFLGFRCAKNVK